MKNKATAEADLAAKMKGPNPETAPNRLLQHLFSMPELHKIQDVATKGRVIDYFKILNKRKI
jgi:hypothetical protein